MSIKMSYVRRNEIHVTVPTVPGPSTYEAGIATEKFQRYKPLRTDQISTETIKREGKKIHCEIHKHIKSVSNKKLLLEI